MSEPVRLFWMCLFFSGVVLVFGKLVGFVPWPWVWVLSPFWVGLGLALFCVVAVLGLASLLGLGYWLIERATARRRMRANEFGL